MKIINIQPKKPVRAKQIRSQCRAGKIPSLAALREINKLGNPKILLV
jgi:hypothetical protein